MLPRSSIAESDEHSQAGSTAACNHDHLEQTPRSGPCERWCWARPNIGGAQDSPKKESHIGEDKRRFVSTICGSIMALLPNRHMKTDTQKWYKIWAVSFETIPLSWIKPNQRAAVQTKGESAPSNPRPVKTNACSVRVKQLALVQYTIKIVVHEKAY